MKRSLAMLVLIAILAGVGAYFTVFIVKETEHAIIHNQVSGVRVLPGPGIYLTIPYLEKGILFPARYQSVDSPPENIVTGDQQKLIVDNFVKWRITDPKRFRDRVGLDMRKAHDRVSKMAHNALKDIMGNKNSRDIIAAGRESLTVQALKIAQGQSKDLGIEIKDIRIKKVDYPRSNITKAFQRMKEERNKEANLFRARGEESARGIRAEVARKASVTRAMAEREAKLLQAQAESDAAEIYLTAYNKDTEFYSFYRSLQALKVTTDSSTTLVISPKSDLFKYLMTSE